MHLNYEVGCSKCGRYAKISVSTGLLGGEANLDYPKADDVCICKKRSDLAGSKE